MNATEHLAAAEEAAAAELDELFARECSACGRRFGLHRAPDNACPNPKWKPGNGEPQWRLQQKFRARVPA
jgi:hypothetical protein